MRAAAGRSEVAVAAALEDEVAAVASGGHHHQPARAAVQTAGDVPQRLLQIPNRNLKDLAQLIETALFLGEQLDQQLAPRAALLRDLGRAFDGGIPLVGAAGLPLRISPPGRFWSA